MEITHMHRRTAQFTLAALLLAAAAGIAQQRRQPHRSVNTLVVRSAEANQAVGGIPFAMARLNG
jgi:hypothetical protein